MHLLRETISWIISSARDSKQTGSPQASLHKGLQPTHIRVRVQNKNKNTARILIMSLITNERGGSW